jgi:potassium-transporting ATPase KdpC subunit
MLKELKSSFLVLLVMMVLTGLLYPLGITGIAKVFFPRQAEGSLIVENGKVVGSELIGQQFDDPKFLWGRLSATSPAYNAAASSGSNLGPTNPALIDEVKGRLDALKAADPDNQAPVPVDLVTSSGSGLDPHISPAAAAYQVSRIAKAGGLPEDAVRQVIAQYTEGRTLGILGEPRVNVLEVNLSLARRYDRK